LVQEQDALQSLDLLGVVGHVDFGGWSSL
jgi:hypothetical protein